MPSRLSLLALGIGAYLAFAIAQFPATIAYRWFAPATLRMSGIEGTVWAGSAALASVPGLPLRDLRWDLHVSRLLVARLAGDFDARLADGFVNGTVSGGPGRVELANLTASTSLQTLRELLPVFAAEGQISVNLAQLIVEDGWPVAASGEVRIGRLRVGALMPTPGQTQIALGDYRAAVAETAGSLGAALSDNGGPLELTGTVVLRPDRSYLLSGAVRPRPEAPDQLLQGLALMTAEPDSDGWRAFEIPGSL